MAKQKRLLFKKCKSDPSLKTDYKNLCTQYKKDVSAWYDRIESKLCNSGNPSTFYKYANKKMKSFECIPPMKLDSGDFATKDIDKANLFNKRFQSVFTEDNGNSLNLTCRITQENLLKTIFIEKINILKHLNELSPKKSKTPDNISCYLLTRIGKTILDFIFNFFNLSLNSGEIPWQWKTSIITPVYKKGSKNYVLNYRPISLTSALCRLFERILCSKILEHLTKNNLLSSNQHGFLSGRSTVSQLLDVTDQWMENYIAKKSTSAVYYTPTSQRHLTKLVI